LSPKVNDSKGMLQNSGKGLKNCIAIGPWEARVQQSNDTQGRVDFH
jgi:hypothetical protein